MGIFKKYRLRYKYLVGFIKIVCRSIKFWWNYYGPAIKGHNGSRIPLIGSAAELEKRLTSSQSRTGSLCRLIGSSSLVEIRAHESPPEV